MMFPTRLNLTFWQKLPASLAWLVALVMANLGLLSAQSNPIPTGNSSQPSQGLPFINAGPDSRFSQLDFAEMYLDQQNKRAKLLEEERRKNSILVETGVVSALDLLAPNNAVQEFNRATTLLKAQDSKEASRYLQKAIHHYPKFVSAHNALGLAYLDQNDPRAKSEFENAAQLDDKFPVSFLNLGLLALAEKDFVAAQSNLEKATRLNPRDAKGLSALAFAQNGNGDYAATIATAQRVHALEHRAMANVHYLAASAAVALNNREVVQKQLEMFLSESPTDALAPIVRQNLETLQRGEISNSAGVANLHPASGSHTFPNSDRLKQELSNVEDEAIAPDEITPTLASNGVVARSSGSVVSNREPMPWTIHKTVDETALFFSVSNHGHMVSDLDLSNIKIRDDKKAPERILQFVPQSKLPLRLALLIDTSGSIKERFAFEKHAAAKFVEKLLNGTSDLGFVAGFNSDTLLTQDFSPDTGKLADGIGALQNGGGTALFDAVSYSCWKLAAYPEQQRVARVVVLLSDGEDNSSHRSLKQVVRQAEDSGVTIYVVSTKEGSGPKSDADRILDLLAERTGGESMFPGDVLALSKSLDKLQDLIRSRYLIAYKPAEFQADGKYRSITITAEKDGKRLQVHARKGYFARLENGHN
jgi:Ca-activated chloride channel family protein